MAGGGQAAPAPAPAPAAQQQITAGPPAAAPGPDWGGYRNAVHQHLNAHKQYPPRALRRMQEGALTLELTVDAAGRVLAARLVEPSGHRLLDKAGLELVRQAQPLPALPPGVERHTFKVPVRYALHR